MSNLHNAFSRGHRVYQDQSGADYASVLFIWFDKPFLRYCFITRLSTELSISHKFEASLHEKESLRLKIPIDRIDLYTQSQGPGLIYAVVRDGHVMDQKYGGYADLDHRTLIDANTIFNIASNTKAFTAAALLVLERDGLVRLDDPVILHLPELPQYAANVQIKHLLYHASGLPSYHPLWNSPVPIENKDVMEFLHLKARLDFAEGSKIEYSNTGYVLLGEVIQRKRAEDFPGLVERSIFKPLGMSDSSVLTQKHGPPNERLAIGYDPWPYFEINNTSRADHVYGDGGLLTSISDYVKWIQALTKPGFFSEAELRRIFAPGLTDLGVPWEYKATGGGFCVNEVRHEFTDGKKLEEGPTGYGYGWILSQLEGVPYAVHGGRWCGFRSAVAFFPESCIWIVMFSNYAGILREKTLSDLIKKHWPMIRHRSTRGTS